MAEILPILIFIMLFLVHYTSLSQDGVTLLQIKNEDWRDMCNALSDWNGAHPNPCRWRGISCDAFNAVSAINITGASISGNLTSSICALPHLTSLILQRNAFSGPFPRGLLRCKCLQIIDLSSNQFSGKLPARIFQLRELKVFNLADNVFTGSVSTFLGNLSQLESLDMSSNQLAGDIPSSLTGLSNLRLLKLSENNLSGRILATIGQLRSLRSFDLTDNKMQGIIPKGISNLTYLDSLILSSNRLTEEIPARLGELWHLRVFMVDENQLTGRLPQSLGTYSRLRDVEVYKNSLEGHLPKNMCMGGALYNVDASWNNLNGTLPSSLEACPSLFSLLLSNNHLSGKIPPVLWGSVNLQYFLVGNNSFEGKISAEIGGAKKLKRLNISNNLFEGGLPAQVGQLIELANFDTSKNRLSGPIPRELAGLRSVSSIKLDHNFLSGEIPKEMMSLKMLSELNLDHNRLTGKVPAALNDMAYLDLSNNSLSGGIAPPPPRFLYKQVALSDHNNNNNNVLTKMEQSAIPSHGLCGSSQCAPPPPQPPRSQLLKNVSAASDIQQGLDSTAYVESFLDNSKLCGGRNVMLPPYFSHRNLSSWIVATILLPPLIIVLVALCSLCLYVWSLRKQSSPPMWKVTSLNSIQVDELHILRNLKESNVIGSGGAGKVYKILLENGQVVAVKKTKNNMSRRGKRFMGINDEQAEEETEGVEVEVNAMGLIPHSNIIKLLCFISSEESEFKLFVYEFIPNDILYDRLHSGSLEWATRYKIVLAAARGLCYLHHDCCPPILHKDVKSSNILLDGDLVPKIADFGTSRELDKIGDEYTVSFYVGSHGYIAPVEYTEYVERLKVNEKSDMYSFGVVVLELVSGKKAMSEAVYGVDEDIVSWIRNTIRACKEVEVEVLDQRLVNEKCIEEMMRVLSVGLFCTNRQPNRRPLMRRVVDMLLACNGDNMKVRVLK